MATAPPSADAVLVRRLRERDRSAWEELYSEFAPRLRPFAYRLTGNRHDADDLLQETFVRALPRLDKLDPETVELGPYLFTTLRNIFLTSVERGRRAEPVADVPEPDVPAPIEDDPERSTLLHRQQEEVRVANSRLAPRQRLVLALRELEDRSYVEIGVIVGLKENAVAQLISRARENLRTELRLTQVDPSRLPEECRRLLPLLSRHLDGQLRGAQLDATLAHVESCERCQETLLAMREAQRRYRVLLPPFGGDELGGGDEQRERIDAELTAGGYWSTGPPRRSPMRGRSALVAASVALLVAGAGGVGAAVLVTKGGRSVTGAPISPKTTTAAGETAQGTTTATPSGTAAGSATTATAGAGVTTARVTTVPATPATHRPTRRRTTTRRTTEPETTTQTTSAIEPGPTEPAIGQRATPQTEPSPPVEPTTALVDVEAPTVTIVARPEVETMSGDASFSFRASEAGASLSCRLDQGGFAPCSSPAAYRGLTPGPHSFSVRARDQAGNSGPAASFDWTVLPPPDTTPPTVTIVSAATPGSDATFEFTSSETGSTFSCSLDAAAFDNCSSPRVYSALAPGRHAFAVRATDAAGNTGPQAIHVWIVTRPLPDLVVSALTETSFTVTNVGTAAAGPFVVSVTLIGTFSFSGLAPGQSVARTWSACRVGTLTAIADRGRAVAESREDNNTRSLVSDC